MTFRRPIGRTFWNPCADGCAGWFLSGETHRVERCDECDRFRDDIEAAEHVAAFGWQVDARMDIRENILADVPADKLDAVRALADQHDRHGLPRNPARKLHGAETCQGCGSTRVQHLDWVDSNRERIVGGGEPQSDGDFWCERCEENQYPEWFDLADIRPNARKLRKALKGAAATGAHKLPHQKP